jgi:hypothetical protein
VQRAESCRRRLHYPEKLTFHLLEAAGALNTSGARRVAQMDFTPDDMVAVQSCLEGIDRNVVAVEGAAAKLQSDSAASRSFCAYPRRSDLAA